MEKSNKVTPGFGKQSPFTFLAVYWGPVIIWMMTIFLLSSQKSVTVSPDYWLNFAFFKMLHVIEYSVLFTLNYRAFAASVPGNKPMWGPVAFLGILLYAVSDETHQLFVATRSGAVRDVIIDASGALCIWYFLSVQLPKAPGKLKDWAKNWDIPW